MGATLAGKIVHRTAVGVVAGWTSIDGLLADALANLRDGLGDPSTTTQNLVGDYTSAAGQTDKHTDYGAMLTQGVYVGGVSGDPASERDFFPELLSTLTLGVDYDVRPDRTPEDEDAYVEYEPGDNTLVGWQPWHLTFDPTDAEYVHPPDDPVPATISYRVAIDPTPYWPAGPIPNDEDVPWAAWGDGDTAATVTFAGDNGGGTIGVDVATPADPSTLRFTLLVQDQLNDPGYTVALGVNEPVTPDLSEGAQLTFFGEMVGATVGDGVVITGPTYAFQMPRWRYWIPEEPPLRQRQRNDGRALAGTRRWSLAATSSRQASNRWRGYL